MSDNPFASPVESGSQQLKGTFDGEGKIPENYNALKTILIFCLILGGIGFLGSVMGLVGLAFQSTIAEMQQTADPMVLKMQEIQNQQMLPNIIMICINVIIAPMLFAGGLGGLLRKQWALGLLRIALLSAAIFVGLRTVVTSIMQVSMMGEMKTAFSTTMQPGGGAQQSAEIAGTAMQVGMIIGVGIGAIMALMLIAFYLWSWTYTKKDKVRRYFGLSA